MNYCKSTNFILPKLIVSHENSPADDKSKKIFKIQISNTPSPTIPTSAREIKSMNKRNSFLHIFDPSKFLTPLSPSPLPSSSNISPKSPVLLSLEELAQSAAPRRRKSTFDTASHKSKAISVSEIKKSLIVNKNYQINEEKNYQKSICPYEEENEATSLNELKSENELRLRAIQKLKNKFDLEASQISQGDLCKVQSIKTITCAERILNLYGITQRLILTSKNEGNFQVKEMLDESFMASAYQAIIPELCKFPFSFFKNLNIKLFRFCGGINLHRPDSKSFGILKQIYSGLFSVDLPDTCKEQFYKMIIVAFKDCVSNFDEIWSRIYYGELQRNCLCPLMLPDDDRLASQATELMNFIERPQDFTKSKNKLKQKIGEFFRCCLGLCDPAGCDNEWLESLSSIGIDSSSDELSLKIVNSEEIKSLELPIYEVKCRFN